ncbi:RNA-directed DNA polymerase, eukaryota [Tanacetum coccineum]
MRFQELNNRNAIEISQKAKIRWSIEGDENSKYFHGIMNKKRSQLAIRGTLANGDWISEPHKDKNEFLLISRSNFLLSKLLVYALTSLFQLAYHFPRGCNSSFIALIPKIQDAKFVKDFRPISLIGSVYKIIAKILANRLCLVLPYLISDVQSAFVANRQILDGPFILNELLSWCKFKKLNGMIFKVDFEKAFDSVKWDYLDETLKAFGFGLKWRNWISSCLNNAMGSVLVNGSPTLEFQFHKGLKQGLKINVYKSKLMGIGVSSNAVAAAASLIGCSILTAPFNYLGVKVGSNMSRINSWDDVISKNLFYGVDGSDRKLAWIGWNIVLTSKKNGGLGALDTHKLIPRSSLWQDVILAIHSLQREVALKVLYKRLYALEMCKSISVAEKMGHPFLSHYFRRMPRGGVEHENYSLLCSKVADLVLPNISDIWSEVPTRWLRVVPIMVNVHAWRVCLDKLPTRANLSLRGMDIPSIACPLCNSAVESTSHIFFACPLARQVWREFFIWYLLRDVVVNLALQKSIALWKFSTKACSLIR